MQIEDMIVIEGTDRSKSYNFLYCHHCGTYIASRKRYSYQNCPRCGKKTLDFIHADSTINENKITTKKDIINYLASCQNYRGLETVDRKMDAIDQKICDSDNLVTNNTDEQVSVIKNTDVVLKEYLKNIIEIETAYYAVRQRLKTLYEQEYITNELINYSYKQEIVKNEKKLTQLQEDKKEAEKRIRSLSVKPKVTIKKPIKPIEPTKPVLQQAGFFNKKKTQAANDALTKEYETALQNYYHEIEQYNTSLADYNEEKKRLKAQAQDDLNQKLEAKDQIDQQIEDVSSMIKTIKAKKAKYFPSNPDLFKKSFIEEEIKIATKMLLSLNEGRNKFYSYNIVYPKYRNLVAISSFYEYLESGRCRSLEGSDGAYNIYENEIRLNHVITQLAEVINSLEQIKNNQFLIYSQLQSINTGLNSLNAKMNAALISLDSIDGTNKSIADNIDLLAKNSKAIVYNIETLASNSSIIAYNTEKTAFYAKKNAELTNALGFLIALK